MTTDTNLALIFEFENCPKASKLFVLGHLGSQMFLPITSYRKGLQLRAWSHFTQLVKRLHMICILTYFDQIWPWGYVTWGQVLTLTFRGQTIHILTRLDEGNTMAFELWLYLILFKSYWRKTAWSVWVIDVTTEVTIWPWALNIGTVDNLMISPQ